ncbi:uncharacterized protein LY89DRAFT_498084 [Mollisia scopiformis]|uniref:Uncharacterized protein n=1 Tax=Mollisia scopiformis TaxID=149040 RepID=A0A194XED6_MOLSC|nr:uncharacterized protein LY89DRAFT_498084 [Mollisia scopiformis]KUJ18506.1 hypothetical protein LY89DRAFT_498084 [Mollisia scopiformis]
MAPRKPKKKPLPTKEETFLTNARTLRGKFEMLLSKYYTLDAENVENPTFKPALATVDIKGEETFHEINQRIRAFVSRLEGPPVGKMVREAIMMDREAELEYERFSTEYEEMSSKVVRLTARLEGREIEEEETKEEETKEEETKEEATKGVLAVGQVEKESEINKSERYGSSGGGTKPYFKPAAEPIAKPNAGKKPAGSNTSVKPHPPTVHQPIMALTSNTDRVKFYSQNPGRSSNAISQQIAHTLISPASLVHQTFGNGAFVTPQQIWEARFGNNLASGEPKVNKK